MIARAAFPNLPGEGTRCVLLYVRLAHFFTLFGFFSAFFPPPSGHSFSTATSGRRLSVRLFDGRHVLSPPRLMDAGNAPGLREHLVADGVPSRQTDVADQRIQTCSLFDMPRFHQALSHTLF